MHTRPRMASLSRRERHQRRQGSHPASRTDDRPRGDTLLQNLANFLHAIGLRETLQRIRQWITTPGVKPGAQRDNLATLGDGEKLAQIVCGEPRHPPIRRIRVVTRSTVRRGGTRPFDLKRKPKSREQILFAKRFWQKVIAARGKCILAIEREHRCRGRDDA